MTQRERTEGGFNFNAQTWIAWLGATVVAVAMALAFAFTTFETKADAKDNRDELREWLVRVEGKLDNVIKTAPPARAAH